MIIEITSTKDRKGKNRLRQSGSQWRVLKEDVFDDKPALMTESVKDGYLKWWIVSEIDFKEVKSVPG